ncbi:MAG: phosphoglucomutase, alpha-D-glucose phosphate-specific [Elusimicrobiota bacterium]|jgi:phosphoglucomutase|nr:phosphoglucomutase, alpha-D-glucose phosphate-specific [Elusimicrobiota bacterium]
MINANAGKLPQTAIDLEELKKEFYNPSSAPAAVKFGTSGHRGVLGAGFCALHARAVAQAVAEMHVADKISGPVLAGGDTRLMSRATAQICACVLAANGIKAVLPDIAVPTPVFSFEILSGRVCAGLNGTASHNPPQDMGLKYNPASGGPAPAEITARIEKAANYYLANPQKIKEIPLEDAMRKSLVVTEDVITPYVKALGKKINFEVIKSAGVKSAIHPMGGASLAFYDAIKKEYGLDNLDIVSRDIDPTFKFIPLDHDGKTRMDPSSQYPMKPLLDLVAGGAYAFAGASDPDADRFGCATAKGGLISPNHALCVMLDYLIRTMKPPKTMKAGRTLGTTHLIDKICAAAGLGVLEVNVGFKYFVEGLRGGELLMAGEESAGMSLAKWVTEKDGILAVFLLLEIMSTTGQDIAGLYKQITALHGAPAYTRVDMPINDTVMSELKKMTAAAFANLKTVAGERVLKVRDTDGVKIYLEDSWFLARPSGTEPIVKFYCESFRGRQQLDKIIEEGRRIFGI